MRRNSGFTLIELLVQIAIIAILAAILFPVFVNAKERARQIKCCTNLKQLTQAFFSYADDNNGLLPMGSRRFFYTSGTIPVDAACIEWTGTQWRDWGEEVRKIDVKRGSLWKYVHNAEVYNCPTDRNMPSWYNGHRVTVGEPCVGAYGLSYSMNYYLCLKSVPGGKYTTVKLGPATAGRAGQILFLIHETRGNATTPGINDGYFSWPGDFYDKIHYEGTACSYADGHVKWLPNLEMKRCENANPSPWWRNSYYYFVSSPAFND